MHHKLMRRTFLQTVSGLPAIALGGVAARTTVHRGGVANRVEDNYVPAPFEAQQIRGVLGDRLDVNIHKRLIEGVDMEALLAGYRARPGQQAWIGEHIGKFIDAATNAWAYSGDERLKKKLDSAVKDLLATQLPDGYLGTYLEADRFVDFGDAGFEPSQDLPLWDVWVHKYNLIGLLNYYDRTGYEPALAACRRIGDLLCSTYGDKRGQRSIARNDWHVGMANSSVLGPMATLYGQTGETKYLDFCRYIVRAWDDDPKGPKIIRTLKTTGSVQKVANAKAYEMMSNFVGLLELYRLTGDETFLRPVLIAWDDIVANRLYVTGTASWGELFREDHLLRADGSVGEGCVTTTWMQINLELLRLTAEAKYADQLERTIYNALLAAQHPESGLICYFVPLNGNKRYGAVSQGEPGVNCCTSSVARGLSLVPSVVWGERRGGIAVNLYTPGSVRLPVGGNEVTLVSTTRFPAAGEVALELKMSQPARFPLSLRVPSWCREFVATAAGETFKGSPGTYLEIERTWNNSDTVQVRMDLTTRVRTGGPAYPDHVALQRGPLVLAADNRINPEVDLWIAGLDGDKALELREAGVRLAGWRGMPAYAVHGYTGNSALGKKPNELVLVPVADAGQQGGEYRVWLQRP